MGVQTIKVATCDECGEALDLSGEWIDAGVYGVVFHVPCWEKIGGPRVARVLYLDDLRQMKGDESVGIPWSERR